MRRGRRQGLQRRGPGLGRRRSRGRESKTSCLRSINMGPLAPLYARRCPADSSPSRARPARVPGRHRLPAQPVSRRKQEFRTLTQGTRFAPGWNYLAPLCFQRDGVAPWEWRGETCSAFNRPDQPEAGGQVIRSHDDGKLNRDLLATSSRSRRFGLELGCHPPSCSTAFIELMSTPSDNLRAGWTGCGMNPCRTSGGRRRPGPAAGFEATRSVVLERMGPSASWRCASSWTRKPGDKARGNPSGIRSTWNPPPGAWHSASPVRFLRAAGAAVRTCARPSRTLDTKTYDFAGFRRRTHLATYYGRYLVRMLENGTSPLKIHRAVPGPADHRVGQVRRPVMHRGPRKIAGRRPSWRSVPTGMAEHSAGASLRTSSGTSMEGHSTTLQGLDDRGFPRFPPGRLYTAVESPRWGRSAAHGVSDGRQHRPCNSSALPGAILTNLEATRRDV